MPAPQRRSNVTTLVKHNWVTLLPVATALVIGVALLLTSGVFGGKAALLSEPGKSHIHFAMLYPDGNSGRILVGTHTGLYERSAKLDEPGWRAVAGGQIGNTDAQGLAYNPTQPRRLYAVGHSIGVAESSDGGANWHNLLPGVGAAYNPNDVHALTIDPADGSLYIWTQKQGLWRSRDQGANWQPITSDAGGEVVCLLVSGTTSGQPTLYAGTTGGLLRSADGGAHWQPLVGSWLRDGVYSLSHAGSTLYAGTPGGLYQSSDGGGSWQVVAALPAAPVVGISVNQIDLSQRLAMFNDTSIYESADGGASWQPAATLGTP